MEDGEEGEGLLTIEKLVKERVQWSALYPQTFATLEGICRRGIPLCYRVKIWAGLGGLEDLKQKSQTALSYFSLTS